MSHDEKTCVNCTGEMPDRSDKATCTCGAPRGSDHGILCPVGHSDDPDDDRPSDATHTCGTAWAVSTGPGRVVGAIARSLEGVMTTLPDDFDFQYCPKCNQRNMTPELEQRFLAVEQAAQDAKRVSAEATLLDLARKAVESNDARRNEDVDAWAERLAADSVAAGEAEFAVRTCGECGRTPPDHREDCPVTGMHDAATRALRAVLLMTHVPYRSPVRERATGKRCLTCSGPNSHTTPFCSEACFAEWQVKGPRDTREVVAPGVLHPDDMYVDVPAMLDEIATLKNEVAHLRVAAFAHLDICTGSAGRQHDLRVALGPSPSSRDEQKGGGSQ